MKQQGVPEKNIPLSRQEALLLESLGLSGHPVMVTLACRWITCPQVRLRVIIELGKPGCSVGTGAEDKRPTIGKDVFTSDPTPDQKAPRENVKNSHVLVQSLAASAAKRDARGWDGAMPED